MCIYVHAYTSDHASLETFSFRKVISKLMESCNDHHENDIDNSNYQFLSAYYVQWIILITLCVLTQSVRFVKCKDSNLYNNNISEISFTEEETKYRERKLFVQAFTAKSIQTE